MDSYKKKKDILKIIKNYWFVLIIIIVFIIFLFNQEIAIWLTIIFLIILILFYLPSLSFKSKLIRFMNKYSTIEDKTVAQGLKLPLGEIKEVMQKLFKGQKKNKWLIVFLNNRYIFYREDTIRKFEELYYKGFNEKRIFDTLKSNIDIKTRAEIKAIIDTLINLKRLKIRSGSVRSKKKQLYK